MNAQEIHIQLTYIPMNLIGIYILLQHRQILALPGKALWEDQIEVVQQLILVPHVPHPMLQVPSEEQCNSPANVAWIVKPHLDL